MPYSQGDLVWLNEDIVLPDGKKLDHPVLIISNRSANSRENHYTAVMLTASTIIDDLFTFKLKHEMFEAKLSKENCQVRLHILVSIREGQIRKLANRMRKEHYSQVIKRIKEFVLSID